MNPATAIEKVIGNDSTVTRVNFNSNALFNSLADEHAVNLAKGLANNSHVVEVKLSDCGISNAGALAFAEVLKVNPTLTHLDLSNNKIDNSGILAIAEALRHNDGLLELHLLGNQEPGEITLSTLIESFEYNTSLLNIVWRLTSRQSFKVNQCLTRNKEIERRKKLGKSVDDIDPNIRRETEKKILAEREGGVKFVPPEIEIEPSEPYPATGGPYSLKILQAKKELLPSDVNPDKREEYLSDEDFNKVLKMGKDDFARSPTWKRNQKKKDAGIF